VKVIVNILLTLIVLIAFLSACWLSVKTDNYWAVIFILVVVGLYFFLTWSFKRGSLKLSAQQFTINTLIGLAIMGCGITLMWLGFSEFSAPVHFSRTFSNLIANLIRNTIGSIGVSLLMWWFGGVFIFMAIERLRPSKHASPNPSFKRDA
jgi:cation transport ATPase